MTIVAVPLPFNVNAADFSTSAYYQAADSLSEPVYAAAERKHQAFRPVSTTTAFTTAIYGGNTLSRSRSLATAGSSAAPSGTASGSWSSRARCC